MEALAQPAEMTARDLDLRTTKARKEAKREESENLACYGTRCQPKQADRARAVANTRQFTGVLQRHGHASLHDEPAA